MSKSTSGFSLLELMIVMVILGLLAAVLVPKIMDRPSEARVTKAVADMRAMETALRFYKLDNGRYPTTEQGLMALIEEPQDPPVPKNYRSGGYLEAEAIPTDPWGTEYIYRSPGDGSRDYEIISLGADGEEGGDGFDGDIGSWEKGQ